MQTNTADVQQTDILLALKPETYSTFCCQGCDGKTRNEAERGK